MTKIIRKSRWADNDDYISTHKSQESHFVADSRNDEIDGRDIWWVVLFGDYSHFNVPIEGTLEMFYIEDEQ